MLLTFIGFQRLHAIGEWKIYNGTSSFSQAVFFDDKIFAITGSSLCSFQPDEWSDGYAEYNRISGLSSSSVSRIYATRDSSYLCIAYVDGNIDILDTDDTIWNIPDLYSKALTESKEVRSIIEGDDGNLYLSGEYGFLQVCPGQKMVLQSVQNRKDIDFAFSFEGCLYRCSRQGHIEYCDTQTNAADIRNWHKVEGNANATIVNDAKVFSSAGKLYCWFTSADTHIYELTPDHKLSQVGGIGQCRTLYPLRDLVLVAGNGYLALTEPARRTFSLTYAQPFVSGTSFLSQTDTAFYALHDYYGIIDCQVTQYVPDVSLQLATDVDEHLTAQGIGTFYLGSLQLTSDHEVVGIARRSATAGYAAATNLPGCISRFDFDQDQWHNVPIQQIVSRLDHRPNFNGLSSLSIDPLNDQRYAIGSWLFGLYVVDHDTLLCRYDETSSHGGVDQFDASFPSTRVTAVAYDDDGRLFFANAMQDTVLRCLTPEGRFYKYPNPGFSQVSDACQILIARHDQVGLKWVLNDYGFQHSRVGIYYDNGLSPEQLFSGSKPHADYQTTWFSTLVDQDLNEYVPNYIYGLCEDLDGKMWVLTNFGPFVIEEPIAAFNYAQQNTGRGKVRRVKIPRNDGTNLADYLMEATDCTCMAIDNFNRKWIGTKGAGLYLLSADCITEIEHFSTDNSPLLSDNILDLCYDHESGQLFISCEGGVLSYQTDAIEGEADYSGIYCYPNPVRPEYGGELRIMGLMNDSQVSITTTSGELVYRTQSQGASTTWDLRTASGQRVDPGVYLIHGVDAQGKKGGICKFLVL